MLQHGTIAAALHDMASLGGFFALRVGTPDEGRRPVLHGRESSTSPRRSRAVTALGSRVAVSIAPLGHAARLRSPALACVVLYGIVHDLEGLQRAGTPGAPRGRLVRRPARRWSRPRLCQQGMGHLSALADGLRFKIAPSCWTGARRRR
ncbi:hypothetical protein ACFT5D_03880 [Streptomyces sp. NPDC057144]|uniref:hypothetical protein n=1 Tax=Streptomyces sp. NPDC057144 TaxID=3346034 RepID=UPI003635E551